MRAQNTGRVSQWGCSPRWQRPGAEHQGSLIWAEVTRQMLCCQDYWVIEETSSLFSHPAVSDSLWPHGLWHARLLSPWNSPVKNMEWVAMSFPAYSSDWTPNSEIHAPYPRGTSRRVAWALACLCIAYKSPLLEVTPLCLYCVQTGRTQRRKIAW